MRIMLDLNNGSRRRGHAALLKICELCLIAPFFFALPQAAHSQSKTGTTIGQFLLIEPGARAAGMGNAAVTSYADVTDAYFNPGAIGLFQGLGAAFTHSLWLADIAYDYAAANVPLGELGHLFLSVTSLNSGEIDVRTVEQPLGTGERYSVTNLALALGFGRQITDRFSAGVQVTYLRESIWHSSLASFALNVGTIYRLAENGLHLGASIVNFGLPARYSGRDLRIRYDDDPNRFGDNSNLPAQLFTEEFPLPVLFRVGISWPVQVNDNHQLVVAVNAFHPSDNTESLSLGVEWKALNLLALRAGYQNLFLEDSEVGLTLGAGLDISVQGNALHFDYAWADHGRLQNTQRFTLGIRF